MNKQWVFEWCWLKFTVVHFYRDFDKKNHKEGGFFTGDTGLSHMSYVHTPYSFVIKTLEEKFAARKGFHVHYLYLMWNRSELALGTLEQSSPSCLRWIHNIPKRGPRFLFLFLSFFIFVLNGGEVLFVVCSSFFLPSFSTTWPRAAFVAKRHHLHLEAMAMVHLSSFSPSFEVQHSILFHACQE